MFIELTIDVIEDRKIDAEKPLSCGVWLFNKLSYVQTYGDQCKFFVLLTYVFKTMSSRFWFCEDEKGLEPSINHERHSICSENET